MHNIFTFISVTSSVVRFNSGITALKLVNASSALAKPLLDISLISTEAFFERSASFLTSEATTAKPFPCSPARAASTQPLAFAKE